MQIPDGMYWSYKADTGVRTAITVVQVTDQRWGAFFGDLKANVYEVDAITGELIWKVHVDDHASARITGAPKVFENRVYVPVASEKKVRAETRPTRAARFAEAWSRWTP